MLINKYLPGREIAMCPSIPSTEPDAAGTTGANFWSKPYTDRWWFQSQQRYVVNTNGGSAVWYDWNGCDDVIIENGGGYVLPFFEKHAGAVWMFTGSRYGHTAYGAAEYVVFGQHNDRISICFANGVVKSELFQSVRQRFTARDPEYCWGSCKCHKGKSPGY